MDSTSKDDAPGTSGLCPPDQSITELAARFHAETVLATSPSQASEEKPMLSLDTVLAVQHRDRSDTNFSRKCIFCPNVIGPTRADLFDHMLAQHHFNMGHPDNLVFLDDLLDKLEAELDALRCIYCHKVFKSAAVLRLHMRKKKHFKIDGSDTSYDKYYIVNYTQDGKPCENDRVGASSDHHGSNRGDDGDTADDAHWGSWTEEVDDGTVQCVFCVKTFPFVPQTLDHCKEEHDFDFLAIRDRLKLSFYESVQVINYLRHRVVNLQCVSCDFRAATKEELYEHFATNKDDCKLPEPGEDGESPVWANQQYLFPILDNDPLLCGFDPDLDEDEDEMG